MSTVGAEGVEKGWRRGTHRVRSPAETLARVEPARAACGITRLANVTGLDRIGLPVMQAIRPNARSVAVSMGKGLDRDSAAASALVEAIEVWHAEHVDRPLRLACRRELTEAGLAAVDGRRLPVARARPFDPRRTMLWSEGHDLMQDRPCWVPHELVHADDTVSLPGGGGFQAGTNGLAGGNHRLEARLHALCELIERDATTLWFRQRPTARALTRLDLATVDDADAIAVAAVLAAAGFEVGAWVTTSDVGVPTFLVTLLDRRDPLGHPGLGAGCHPAKEVALLRALLEAAQVRLAYIAGARDDIEPASYGAEAARGRSARARALAVATPPALDYRALPTAAADTLDADCAFVLEHLQAVGIDQAVEVELTRPAIGLPVVRLVVPGLEGADDHPDYAPGARAQAVEVR